MAPNETAKPVAIHDVNEAVSPVLVLPDEVGGLQRSREEMALKGLLLLVELLSILAGAEPQRRGQYCLNLYQKNCTFADST
jgi:hypothetical protein